MAENSTASHAAASEPLLPPNAHPTTSTHGEGSSTMPHHAVNDHGAPSSPPSSPPGTPGKQPNVVSSEDKPSSQHNHPPQKLDKHIPLIMGCSLLAALIFALVHHFFYRYWNGKVVASDTQQQWIVRGGTAFAFGFKTSLVAGSGAAYVQYLWLSLRKRPFKVGEIDSLFDVLASAIRFANLRLWVGVPVLALLALITWALPLAAIITPGTLIVSPKLQNTTRTSVVPSLDFTSNAYNFGVFTGGDALDQFGYARDEVVRIALASATSGSILAMTPPSPNATYTLAFYAPGLRCVKANDTAFQTVVSLAANSSQWGYAQSASYFSWVPFQQSGSHGTSFGMPSFNNTAFTEAVDSGANTTAGSLISVFTYIAYNETGNFDTHPPKPIYLNCGLRNISYTAHFAFASGAQSLSITSSSDAGPINSWKEGSFTSAPAQLRTFSYLSIMFAFNRLITGSILRPPKSGTWQTTSTTIQSTRLGPALLTATNNTLAASLEQLFQNITLSMFTSPSFLADPRNSTLAQRATVTQRLAQNIYHYDPLDLYLAYGLALLAGVCCLGIGILALRANGAAYTASFTTYLRTTRQRELDALVVGAEASGCEPVGRRVTEARLVYRLAGDGSAGFRVVKRGEGKYGAEADG